MGTREPTCGFGVFFFFLFWPSPRLGGLPCPSVAWGCSTTTTGAAQMGSGGRPALTPVWDARLSYLPQTLASGLFLVVVL